MSAKFDVFAKECIDILESSNYIDPSEYLYDAIKIIKSKQQKGLHIDASDLMGILWALESGEVYPFDDGVSIDTVISSIKKTLE